MGGEHQPGVLPSLTGQGTLLGLAFTQCAKRFGCHLGQAEGAAGPLGLGLAVHADRSPYRNVRGNGRLASGVAKVLSQHLPGQLSGLVNRDHSLDRTSTATAILPRRHCEDPVEGLCLES